MSETSSGSHHTDILEAERENVLRYLDRHCNKSVALIDQRASSSALKRLDSRLEHSLRELKIITEDLMANNDRNLGLRDDARLLGKMRQRVEEHQDLIADNIETRSTHTQSEGRSYVTVDEIGGSSSASSKQRSVRHRTKKTALVKNEPTIDGNKSDAGSDGSSKSSTRSAEARIKAEVADLRVKQEKQLYLNELQLKEAEERLKLQKETDAAARAKLEAELWESREENSGWQGKTDETPKGSQPRDINWDRKSRDYDASAFTMHPEDRMDTSVVTPRHAQFDYKTRFSNTPKHERDMRTFFQGMAKPKLPKFSGEKGQYRPWFEQFDIFVNQADVPVKFKMVMLKNSPRKKEANLVSTCGLGSALNVLNL
jgi:hypothetical protein